MKSREKRIKSGNQLEVEIYPVTEHGHRYDRKRKLSRPEQQALNEKNAIKTFIRLVNTNFVSGDIVITLEYNKDKRPSGYNQIKRDVQNYIRRIKYYRNKHDLPIIKYVYVIELQGVDHWHCHMIMSKIAREVAESLWDNADFVNSKSFQPTQQDGGGACFRSCFRTYARQYPAGCISLRNRTHLCHHRPAVRLHRADSHYPQLQ